MSRESVPSMTRDRRSTCIHRFTGSFGTCGAYVCRDGSRSEPCKCEYDWTLDDFSYVWG